MPDRSCFVIMPIGDQKQGDATITADQLKQRYTYLIKEAILKARPNLKVVRADEVSRPGGIATDIYTQLMHSEFVVADITYPNPNVFYELGLRHACKYGTILIKGNDGPHVPFDLAGHRHIAYDNTPPGLKALSNKLDEHFQWLEAHALEPDNEFQTLAKFTKYEFPMYRKQDTGFPGAFAEAMAAVVEDPIIKPIFRKGMLGETLTTDEMQQVRARVADSPEHIRKFALAIILSGRLPV